MHPWMHFKIRTAVFPIKLHSFHSDQPRVGSALSQTSERFCVTTKQGEKKHYEMDASICVTRNVANLLTDSICASIILLKVTVIKNGQQRHEAHRRRQKAHPLQIQNGGHLCESSKLVAHSPGGHWWQVANQCSQFFVKLQSTQLKNHSTKVTCMDKCLTNTWNCMSNRLFHPYTPNWNPQYKGHTDKCSTNTCNCVSNFIPPPQSPKLKTTAQRSHRQVSNQHL